MVTTLALWLGVPRPAAAAGTSPTSGCSDAAHRRFDFWIGDWDAYDVGANTSLAARVRVESILGGCALREIYDGVNGLSGQSLTIYDAARSRWHQTWVTSRGQLLQADGLFEEAGLTLAGPWIGPDGRKSLLRATWTPQGNGVRETAQMSRDGGRSWEPLFDMEFRRRAGAEGKRRRAPAPSPGERRPA